MKKLFSICSFIFFCTLLCSNNIHRPPVVSGPFLGFNLMPGANNNLVNFALVVVLPNGQKSVQAISRNDFIRVACSQQPQDGNPLGENLFAKYEIEECGMYKDSIFKKVSFICSSVDQLWKLRYKMGPYGGSDSLGWTGATVPSSGQMDILRQYGAQSLDDFIYGENAFHLLHDIQSYAWQSRYKGS